MADYDASPAKTYNTSGLAPVIVRALDRYKLEDEAFSKQRRREIEDLEFQVADPEHHWAKEAREMRGAQTVNGQQIPGQPMLALPTLDQPIQLILNQERAAHLAVTVHPLSEDAEDETAEAFNDIYRGIQRDSRAGRVRSWAFERAVKSGRGAYRVLAVPDQSGQLGDQKLVIRRLLYQESARWDPYAQEPDFCDAEWGMVSTWVSWETLKRRYKKKKLAHWSDGDFVDLTQIIPAWIRDDKHGKACLVVEMFEKVFGESGEDEDFVIRWTKMTCSDVLDEEDMDCRDIPLVPTIGHELIPFDDERRWEGIIRPNKDSARLVDYAGSNAVAIAALEPKAPWQIADGQDEGYELEYQLSNVRNFPSLHYKPTALGGTLIGPPQRTQVDTSRLGPSMQLLQMGQQFVHGGTGAFEAALGQAAPNAKTKGGTLALQQQHEQGNSHWLDNQVEISLACEARIIVNWIPFIYDRPGRIIYGLDAENKAKPMMLNAPFIVKNGKPVQAPMQQPQMAQQPGAVLGLQQPNPKTKQFDLKKGRYGVTTSAGKDYKSRVEEGSDRLGQLLEADPNLLPVLGPVWAHFQDFPSHEEVERILRKMRDKQFPWLADEDDQPDAAQQLQTAQMQLQEMQGQLKQAAMAIETDAAKQQATIEKSKIDAQAKIELERMKFAHDFQLQKMKDATTITVAQIDALVKGVQLDSQAMTQAVALNQSVKDAQTTRAHELGMRAQEHAQGQEAMEREHAQGLESAAVGQEHALEQGEARRAQSMEQAQQAADLAPEPASDGEEM